MAAEASKRIEIAGQGDKRQITATFTASLDGTFLPMLILYPGMTALCHPKHAFPDGFDIFHTPNHWANEQTCLRFFNKIIIPHMRKVREEVSIPSQKALVLMDNFSVQRTTGVLEKVEEEEIVVVTVPGETTD